MSNANAEAIAIAITSELPCCTSVEDDGDESDLISLCDIVITGMETGWVHWRTRKYDFRAKGTYDDPWAIVEPLLEGLREGEKRRPIALYEESIRKATTAYLASRLARGMGLSEARKLVDGVYTDAEVTDSIIQFAIYGEEVFSG